jgi:photosystem II stability/assembly factor-like uncharacterized protein
MGTSVKITSRAARTVVCAFVALGIAGAPAAASAAGQSVHAARTAVPSSFRASAMSWTSASDGWVLGAKSCGVRLNCKTSQVIGTTNGGKTWRLVGTVDARLAKIEIFNGTINEIRMATSQVGWTYGPDLYRTTDGGRTWHKQANPGGGAQVMDMAVTPTAAYAIVSPCPYGQFVCNKGPMSAWRTSLTSSTWTRMHLPRPLHENSMVNVAAYGSTVYVVNPFVDTQLPTQFYASTDGGRAFAARPNPCPALEVYTLIQAAPSSSGKVALLCDGNFGGGQAAKAVYVSHNTGLKDKFTGQLPPWGIQAQLTMSPTGNLAVGAYSIGSFIDVKDTQATKWTQVIGSGDGGAGFNDITYVSGTVAWVVGAPASLYADFGWLFRSTDAGQKWKHIKLLSAAAGLRPPLPSPGCGGHCWCKP